MDAALPQCHEAVGDDQVADGLQRAAAGVARERHDVGLGGRHEKRRDGAVVLGDGPLDLVDVTRVDLAAESARLQLRPEEGQEADGELEEEDAEHSRQRPVEEHSPADAVHLR